MKHEDIIAEMHALEQTLNAQRVEVWVPVVEPDGTVSEHIYQGSYVPTRDPRGDRP